MNPDQLQGVVSQPISNPSWRFSFITYISIDHWSIPDLPILQQGYNLRMQRITIPVKRGRRTDGNLAA